MQRNHCLSQAVVWKLFVKFSQPCLLGYTAQLLLLQGLASCKDSTLKGSTSPLLPQMIWGSLHSFHLWSSAHTGLVKSGGRMCSRYPLMSTTLTCPSITVSVTPHHSSLAAGSLIHNFDFFLSHFYFLDSWHLKIKKQQETLITLLPFPNSPFPVRMKERPKNRRGRMIAIIALKYFFK